MSDWERVVQETIYRHIAGGKSKPWPFQPPPPEVVRRVEADRIRRAGEQRYEAMSMAAQRRCHVGTGQPPHDHERINEDE